jgi:dTDP-4-amino-4,6-dideoxygalactose transaminase
MNANENIPLVDLVALHQEIEPELMEVFRNTLRTAGFVGGPAVEGFERQFAAFCDAQACVAVASGTDALLFALMAAGIRPGDLVITVPNTFIATTEAISQAGAQPVFVDIDPATYNMSPEALRRYLENECRTDVQTGRCFDRKSGRPVKAVVPVHLYGQTADMDPILDLARHYRLIVVEDACQAHGAEYYSKKDNRWHRAGSMGQAGAFSFYPGKNLGACGEGGAVTTNDKAIAKKIALLRDHGQSTKYYHEVEGYNGRLDSLQAGILSVKLRYLEQWNAARRRAAQQYDDLFSTVEGVITPARSESCRAVYHLYAIRVQDRAGLQGHLSAANIHTGIHYPVPLHLQRAYQHLGYAAGAFPVAESAAAEVLSLPLYPQLLPEQQRRVVGAVKAFVSAQQGHSPVAPSVASPVAIS